MKPFWKSRTFWLNLLILFTQVLEKLTGTGILPDSWLLGAAAAANIALRFVTSEPVSLR